MGREREIAEVAALLGGSTRLLTLYGLGGGGKTRLALAVAQEVAEEFEDGVWWVDLASISDAKLVPRALATVLDVREVPDRSLTESLAEYLAPRRSLVVLDNCEHLVYGCAALADALLRICPYLKILATSREPLRVAGEATWMVPGLSMPDPGRRPTGEQLASYEAIRLFVERAKEANAGFALTERNAPVVARLCRRLDGIPLAIELAAARVRALTAEQISERLENPLGLLTTGSRTASPRHQTLRAALQWSYDLLDARERALFERLAVFAGGWDLQAAEAIGTEDPEGAAQVLDLLSMLMDKSLVVAEEGEEEGSSLRYRMLVPVRQFGREKLRESAGAQDVPRRHAEYFLALAERADPELMGPDQGRWLQVLRTELGNLREALAWSLEPERAEERLRLVAALGRFWGREGFEEGKWWLQVALESDPGGFPAARAKALGELGFILLFMQDYGPAIAALEEAVALYKGLGDESGAAFALANLGYAVLHGNVGERVPAFVEEGEALISGNPDGPFQSYLRIVLACASLWKHDVDSAVALLEESLDISRGLGSLRDVSMALFILANIELNRNDVERGAMFLAEGVRTTTGLKDMLGASYYALALGKLNALRGSHIRAATLWGAAEAFREQMGVSLSHFDLTQSGYERDLILVRSALDEASFESAWAEGRAMSHDQAFELGLAEPVSPDEENQADPYSARHLAVQRQAEDSGRRRHNLPLAQGGFVGRERAIPEIEQTLSKTQLVTLTGAGGCGKTRLALEVARNLVEDYRDGVWLVQLASLTEGELVPAAVSNALGVREVPELTFTESLVDFLRSREMLLVLDNCEHLIEASARLVDTLLSSCDRLHVLATSREPLGVAGEVNWIVPSLTVPEVDAPLDPENLAGYESVQLFVERASSRLPAFALTSENAPAVVDICRKLDGIPLAIELATARMGALAVEQIAERLDDALGFLTMGERTRAPRQRTLRGALEWSYELLSEPEKVLFGRLSVFVGGWTLEAAEAVGAGEPVSAGPMLDLLSALVDKSLVATEADAEGILRYRMLEPVRQYALECLMGSREADEVRRRHAEFFADLAEQAYPKLRAAPQVRWLETLEKENGNLRGALSWLLSVDDIETATRLGWALWPFWWIHNYQPEGRRWMERILLGRDALPQRLLVRAVIATEALAYGQADGEAVVRYAGELLELSREVGGDALAESFAHGGLGLVATGQGDLELATQHLETALPLFHEAGEDGLWAQTSTWLGTILLLQGDHEGARQRFEEGLASGRGIGDRMSTQNALFNLAQLELAGGDYDASFRWFIEGIVPSQELGDRGNVAHILEGLGAVAGARGDAVRAARLQGASEAMISAIGLRGHTYYQFDRSVYERIDANVRSTLGAQDWTLARAEGRAMSPEQAIEYALEPASGEPATPREAAVEETLPPDAGTDVLRIFALGPARVEKDGTPLESPDWTLKPRELLYYLLSHPQGRTKEQIGLALWPEASTSQLRSSFHDTVFRLRRALGAKEWVSYGKGRYAFGRELAHSFDVEDFEENVSEGRRLRSESPDVAIEKLQEAANIYGGDFLEGWAVGEWALERQEELRREYQEALMLLGRLLFARERHAEAAEAYRKAIAHDEYLEEAHRELMRSHAAMGERGRALRHYEELLVLLREKLGASPAPETTELHEILRAGEEAL